MKTLVTGATGFVGSHIAEALKKSGEDVIALVRETSDTKFLESLGVPLCVGELNDPASLAEALTGVEKVYHSAALADEWISREIAHKINVEGTHNLLEASKAQGVKHFVFVSSLAVLGMRDHHGTPADSPYNKTGDAYIDTKIDSEQMALDYYKNYGLPVTVVRPGFVFGPRDKKLIPRIVGKLKDKKFMFVGSGKNKMNIVYIENLTDAIIRAGNDDNAIGKVYNVTNGTPIDVETFINQVADLWGIERPVKRIPKNAAYFLCTILEGGARLVNSPTPPFVTKTRIKFLCLNLDFDIEKTKKELGYCPGIAIDEGLRRTKDWMDASQCPLQ